tara:strand:+ start:676 stop:2754 length:2079 start_codon:yes stop_codon:yes gene_type:complete
MTISDGARQLYEEGFYVLPLGKCSKRPRVSWKEFQNRPATEEEICGWWASEPEGNVGVVTGRGYCVVDADSADAAAWIDAHLPRTPWRVKTGRGWHYYFSATWRVKNIVNERGKVDIRGVGGYVVAPPSIHENGHVYTWHREPGTEGWSVDDLPALTRDNVSAIEALGIPDFSQSTISLESVRMKAKPIPVKVGGRNNAAASLAGQWVNEGLDESQTWEKLSAWNKENPDPLDDAELASVLRSIFKTDKKNREITEPIPRKINISITPPSDSIPDLRPPGALGSLFDWHLETSRHPNKVLAAQTSLAFGSVVLGRRYVTAQNNYPMVYFLTVGKSTTGKEHGKKTLEKALVASGLEHLIGGRGYTSPAAVLSELRDKPNHITIIDEFGDYFEACKAQGNSHRKEAISTLVEVFSSGGGTLRQAAYSQMGMTEKQRSAIQKINIESPSVTLFCLTQPNRFYDSIGDGDIANGFLGRLLVMDMQAERKPGRLTGRLGNPPGNLIAWAKSAAVSDAIDISGNSFEVPPEEKIIGIGTEALGEFEKFEVEKIQLQDGIESSGLEVIVGRMHEISMRLGGIIACSVDINRPVVTSEIARWSNNYCRWSFTALVDAAKKNLSTTDYGKNRQKVLQAIFESGPRGLTTREVNRRFKGFKPKERSEIMRDLQENSEVLLGEIKHKSAGRPRVAWVGVEDA